MRLKDFDRRQLSQEDNLVLDDALAIRGDCNNWAVMKGLWYRAQSPALKKIILRESHTMFHTLEFYEGIEE